MIGENKGGNRIAEWAGHVEDLAGMVAKWVSRRFTIEEGFLDHKSGLADWDEFLLPGASGVVTRRRGEGIRLHPNRRIRWFQV
jgi:hypothetical protein